MSPGACERRETGLLLRVHVKPRARREGVAGMRGGRLQVAVREPPVDDRANERLCEVLAQEFGVAPGRVSVVRGARSRDKDVWIDFPVCEPAWLASTSASDSA